MDERMDVCLPASQQAKIYPNMNASPYEYTAWKINKHEIQNGLTCVAERRLRPLTVPGYEQAVFVSSCNVRKYGPFM